MVVMSPSRLQRPFPMVRNDMSKKTSCEWAAWSTWLREVSGICLHRSDNNRMFLIAISDRAAKIAWFSMSRGEGEGGRIDWHTRNIAKLSGLTLPKHHPQIEAVCADGGGRIL